jgi:aryl-alcohol dehydrogenase-like predicted oxidoreductase
LNAGLRALATRLGTTPAELAIAWVLRQPRITSAIVGARKPGQIAETIGGGRLTIPADALQEIEGMLKQG